MNEDLKSVISSVKVPTTTLRGGQLILSADLSRVQTILVNDKIIHGENYIKVHPILANIYKAIAVGLTLSPRSDRGSTILKWLAESEEELEPIKNRRIVVELPGVQITATVEDAIKYAKAAEQIKVAFLGTPLRVRKEKEVDEQEYEFI